MMRFLFCFMLALTPLVWGQALLSFSGGNEYPIYYSGSTGDVVGWRFQVTDEMQVTNLGVWNNDNTGGMDVPHKVGIWDNTPALICSVTVTTSGTVIDDFIYESIDPISLYSGMTYTIGTLYAVDDSDNYISSASSAVWAPEVTFYQSVYPSSGSLGFVFPAFSTTSTGRFGPNFLFDNVALERSTWGSIKASMQ